MGGLDQGTADLVVLEREEVNSNAANFAATVAMVDAINTAMKAAIDDLWHRPLGDPAERCNHRPVIVLGAGRDSGGERMKYIVVKTIDNRSPGTDVTGVYRLDVTARLIDEGYVAEDKPQGQAQERSGAGRTEQ